jgi:hypothetical protein
MGDPVGNVLKIIEPIETKLSRNVFGWQTSRNLLRSCQSFGLTDMKILSDRKIFCRSEKKAPKNSLSCA